jgi:hypothetical protein
LQQQFYEKQETVSDHLEFALHDTAKNHLDLNGLILTGYKKSKKGSKFKF